MLFSSLSQLCMVEFLMLWSSLHGSLHLQISAFFLAANIENVKSCTLYKSEHMLGMRRFVEYRGSTCCVCY
ncbi:unnamed protein product, partial [Vitis vinifera]|uniref:Secreted protein n=1 Tax=Vitis vinifera TaxID=29760 RepID=E0CSR8_VITVI